MSKHSYAFDEALYVALNPDIRAAIEAGSLASGRAHYEFIGHTEGRPGVLPIDFSEAEYLRLHPAVAAAVEEGALPSGGAHYATQGRRDGLAYRGERTSRRLVIEKLWHGSDPFLNFPSNVYAYDTQGWNSAHEFLGRAIDIVHPRLVVEIGVWKGGSTITMAKKIRELGLDATVVAIDTWLGSSEHWLVSDWFADLGMENGYPKLFHRFMNNVLTEELVDQVVPLPIDSINAQVLFKTVGLRPDVVHIDAGHDYDSVMADLVAWWEMLSPGGVLVADDYYPAGEGWPDVLRAVNDFFAVHDHASFEAAWGKAMVRKP